MRKLTQSDHQQIRDDRRGDLLPTYGVSCFRCEHEWLPRVSDPKRCPSCRSKHWATQRTNRQGLRPGS